MSAVFTGIMEKARPFRQCYRVFKFVHLAEWKGYCLQGQISRVFNLLV